MVRAVVFDYGGVLRRKLLVQRKLLDLAEQLRQRGLQTAVLSNMITPVAFIFRHSPELKRFSPVIISCDVGVSKPDPAIYRLLLEQLKVAPEECIFIDNRADNIAAAKQLGFRVIRASSTNQIISEIAKQLES